MQTTISQKMKTGIFTIIGIFLFVGAIFLIGSKQNMFGDTFMIYGTFNNVSGLNVGNNIRFSGINVGTVEQITIISDTVIRVDMRMKGKIKPFLKADAIATIGSDGLMGDKLVFIKSGSPQVSTLLTAGSQIRTANPIDMEKVMSNFTNVATNANIITTELAGMAIQIRKGNGTISKLLYTDDLSRSLEGTASNAEKITGDLAGVTAKIRTGKGSIGSLVYTDSLSNGLQRSVTTSNGTLLAVQQAADGFGENMKALHGNIFFRGYYKRKARDAAKQSDSTIVLTSATEALDPNMDEQDLKDLITEAQKELDAKHKK
jgi:phospholipid/cholesterol/gamma-HCH transport system substrate-binding protein